MLKIELIASKENLDEEKKVYQKICDCIAKKQSFIFDAGAGAGKTYELMQTLKYIINNYGVLLDKHNQKILCITYTNVAVEEIKKRLGNSRIVEVSTIHESLWDIISPHQEELVKIHLENIEYQIAKIINDLLEESWASTYRTLSNDKQDSFLEILTQNKKEFDRHYNDNAASFKTSMRQFINDSDYPNMFNNVSNFKRIASNLMRKLRYEQAVEKIKACEKKYRTVIYDSRRNTDKLEVMKISHDTLLDYAEKMVKQNQLLRRFIADKFPFVLVDEYQDTNEKVVKLLIDVYDFSRKKSRDFILAFFGDSKQNIYEDGIGTGILNYVSNFERIIKHFNRRSAPEIISIANKIRNDDVVQTTIFNNFPKANVSFYNCLEEADVEKIKNILIAKYCKEWSIDKDNRLHCFELRNESVASRSNFSEIYSFFRAAKFYNGINYKYLAQHVLNLDSKKRGEPQNRLLQILDFKTKISVDETMLMEIVPKEVSKLLNLKILRQLIIKYKTIRGDTLSEYLTSLFNLYKQDDQIYDECIDSFFGELNSLEKYKQFILNELFSHDEELSDEQRQQDIETVTSFFNLPISKFESWYNYLNDKGTANVIFHTFHSTKGLEFDNVLIFFESSFARNTSYFSNFFDALTNMDTDSNDDVRSARNLLYVALTRARYNLGILYSSNLGANIETVENIFGKITSFDD